MEKILLALKIIQEVDNKERRKQGLKYLGRGFSTAVRVNPYNPLSYILIITAIPILIIVYGVREVFSDSKNIFKWD